MTTSEDLFYTSVLTQQRMLVFVTFQKNFTTENV